jgi:hypothetical protein
VAATSAWVGGEAGGVDDIAIMGVGAWATFMDLGGTIAGARCRCWEGWPEWWMT